MFVEIGSSRVEVEVLEDVRGLAQFRRPQVKVAASVVRRRLLVVIVVVFVVEFGVVFVVRIVAVRVTECSSAARITPNPIIVVRLASVVLDEKKGKL